jgi:limonene 1,2-monooxygenase
MVERGAWIVGTPDDCIAGIKRLVEQSGGFGGFLVQTVDWGPRDKMLHSYELLARYVMPEFQGTALGTTASNTWAYERRELLMAGRVQALEHARTDYVQRHVGERTL